MKSLLFLISLVTLLFSETNGQPKVSKITPDDKVIDLIASLPEVINSDKDIIKKTHGKIHLVTYIDQKPDVNKHFYLVTVAEDQKWRLMPHYTFRVDVGSNNVSYWAIIQDTFVPLAVWRKHHYREY